MKGKTAADRLNSLATLTFNTENYSQTEILTAVTDHYFCELWYSVSALCTFGAHILRHVFQICSNWNGSGLVVKNDEKTKKTTYYSMTFFSTFFNQYF